MNIYNKAYIYIYIYILRYIHNKGYKKVRSIFILIKTI